MISIVIPIFNEEKYIQSCLESIIRQKEDYEIIVVDGGSKDGKIDNIKKSIKNLKIIKTKKGRATQFNAGVIKAKGNILLFLHADAILPENSLSLIEKSIAEGFVGGGFMQKFSDKKFLLGLISMRANLRVLMTKVFFGDQGIFVRKDTFNKIGGFKNIPIMEDLDFSKRLRKKGRVKIINEKIIVSGRSYIEKGIVKLTLIYFILMTLYHLGVDYKKIKKVHDFMV